MSLYPKTFKRFKPQKNYKECAVAKNLLDQTFTTNAKNKIWFGDITYIKTNEGRLYLSVFMDAYTRKIVSYSIKSHMREEIVVEPLKTAIIQENPNNDLIIHTDQGSQYLSRNYRQLLIEKGITVSNSRAGNPYDNAVMESFYKSFKSEVMGKVNFKSKAEAKLEILEYIHYYNNIRMHSSLAYVSPVKFENSLNLSV